MKFRFDTALERDMDFLIMEEFSASPGFAEIFLRAAGLTGPYTLLEAVHSQTDAEYGESDVVFLLSLGDRRHALHIEDKIDAPAMKNQHDRYHKRAEKAVANGEYDGYSVVIVAPAGYLAANREAQKYAHRVEYEQLQAYFAGRDDVRSRFRLALIERALGEAQSGYHWQENEDVARFCRAMSDYQREKYPGLPEGSRAWWPYYPTVIRNARLVLKASKGFCDLQFYDSSVGDVFRRAGSRLTDRMNIVKAGKSSAVRIVTKPIDFRKPFGDCIAEVDEALAALWELHGLSRRLAADDPGPAPEE